MSVIILGFVNVCLNVCLLPSLFILGLWAFCYLSLCIYSLILFAEVVFVIDKVEKNCSVRHISSPADSSQTVSSPQRNLPAILNYFYEKFNFTQQGKVGSDFPHCCIHFIFTLCKSFHCGQSLTITIISSFMIYAKSGLLCWLTDSQLQKVYFFPFQSHILRKQMRKPMQKSLTFWLKLTN